MQENTVRKKSMLMSHRLRWQLASRAVGLCVFKSKNAGLESEVCQDRDTESEMWRVMTPTLITVRVL